MEARISQLRSAVRLPARVRAVAMDRVNLALGAVFLLGAAFYLWTAGTSYPLALNGGSQSKPYNLLATTFLHLHLSVGRPPAGLLKLPEPYNPVANSTFQLHPRDIHDFALYHGKLYITWGPTPVIVLYIPLRLLGLEPSTSLTAAIFAVVGLGFALAVLRVVLRQLGRAPLWMCALAALALALSSVVPFTLRRPEVYEDAITSGLLFCDGRHLARRLGAARAAGVAETPGACEPLLRPRGRRAPDARGGGAGARPRLPVVPGDSPRRGLLIALLAPIGVCGLLLALYNQVRFGSPLEVGTKYALAGFNQHTAHFGDASYVAPGAWYYLLAPPRPSILFPFLRIAPPPESYPGTPPANYQSFELTAGLLPMAPILVFLGALPWIWRRRPKLLGSLGTPLLILAGAGAFALLFLSYEFYATTERYEVDCAPLFLLGALAAWLALAVQAPRALPLAGAAAGPPGRLGLLRRHRHQLHRLRGPACSPPRRVDDAGKHLLATVEGDRDRRRGPCTGGSVGTQNLQPDLARLVHKLECGHRSVLAERRRPGGSDDRLARCRGGCRGRERVAGGCARRRCLVVAVF